MSRAFDEMSEAGSPLIPREVLPAPVKPAKTRTGPAAVRHARRRRPPTFRSSGPRPPNPRRPIWPASSPGRAGSGGSAARPASRSRWTPRGGCTCWSPNWSAAAWWSTGMRTYADEPPPVVQASGPPSVVPEVDPVKEEATVRRPSISADDLRPRRRPGSNDLPSDVDFLPDRPEASPRGRLPEAANRHLPPAEGPLRDAGPVTLVTPVAAVSSSAPENSSAADDASPAEDSSAAEDRRRCRGRPAPTPRFEVGTAYSGRLDPLARRGPGGRGAVPLRPSSPALGRRGRLARPRGLPAGPRPGQGTGRAVDAALVRAGLAGRVSDDGR